MKRSSTNSCSSHLYVWKCLYTTVFRRWTYSCRLFFVALILEFVSHFQVSSFPSFGYLFGCPFGVSFVHSSSLVSHWFIRSRCTGSFPTSASQVQAQRQVVLDYIPSIILQLDSASFSHRIPAPLSQHSHSTLFLLSPPLPLPARASITY